ncbi:PIG-L deacetylase family protein [Salinarimonas soli]|nr:PIG-L family deacetylase [Salinarimonas soli]
MPTALALSPHLDDAAFSCGGTLAALSDTGWRVVIATMFTASVPDPGGFALACQLDKGLGPEVDYMALRRAEDARAAAILGAEALWLPFPEAPHRGYHSAPALFAPPLAADRVEEALAPAFRELFDGLAPDLILAPQAVGGHVDHVAAVRALRRVDPPAPVLWWRDYPYVARAATPPEPFGEAFAALDEIVVPLGPDALTRRCRASLAYASQIGFQFGGAESAASAFARSGAAETFRSASGRAVLGGLVTAREAQRA